MPIYFSKVILAVRFMRHKIQQSLTCLQQQSHQCAVFFAGKNASFIVMKVDKDIFNPEL